jgi:hypothetical protein
MGEKLKKEVENIKKASRRSPAYWVCTILSIVLLVSSFILPPTGVIDNSVLTATGILFGFAALGVIDHKGIGKMTKGDTTVSIGNED